MGSEIEGHIYYISEISKGLPNTNETSFISKTYQKSWSIEERSVSLVLHFMAKWASLVCGLFSIACVIL